MRLISSLGGDCSSFSTIISSIAGAGSESCVGSVGSVDSSVGANRSSIASASGPDSESVDSSSPGIVSRILKSSGNCAPGGIIFTFTPIVPSLSIATDWPRSTISAAGSPLCLIYPRLNFSTLPRAPVTFPDKTISAPSAPDDIIRSTVV